MTLPVWNNLSTPELQILIAQGLAYSDLPPGFRDKQNRWLTALARNLKTRTPAKNDGQFAIEWYSPSRKRLPDERFSRDTAADVARALERARRTNSQTAA